MEEIKKEFFKKYCHRDLCDPSGSTDELNRGINPEDVWQWIEEKLEAKDARINSLLDVIAKDTRPTIGEIAQEAKPKREYPADVPNPETQPEEFNEYLRKNNKVVAENKVWIIIENSYIPNQLVAFCKFNVADVKEFETVHYISKDASFIWLFSEYSGKHIYINADKEKSIPNRLHIHIKL